MSEKQIQKRGIQISIGIAAVAVTSEFEEDSIAKLRKIAEELIDKYGK